MMSHRNKITLVSLGLMIIVGLLIFEGLTLVSADVNEIAPVKQNNCALIKQVCSSCSYVNLSISYPNSTIIISNKGMTSIGGGTWTYNFCNTSTLGRYDIVGSGDLSGTPTSFDVLWFDVTPNGEESNGWKITLEIFVSLSTLLLMLLFLYLSGSGIKSKMATMEQGASKFFFMGLALVFLIAHILITNVIIHDTLGVESSMASVYTMVMYVFFTIIILIFLYTLIKVMLWEIDIFLKSKGKR